MSLLEHLRSNRTTPEAPPHAPSVSAPAHTNGAAEPPETQRTAPPIAEAPPPPPGAAPPPPPRPLRPTQRHEALVELRTRVHEELIHDLDPDQLGGDTGHSSPARRAVEQAAEERIGLIDSTLGRLDRLRLASEIADEVLGLGPLEPLLRDPTITEIMV
ncbi:MAG TPA: hypothetical protein VGL99_25790, partial [Chloroflexota bacterium]